MLPTVEYSSESEMEVKADSPVPIKKQVKRRPVTDMF